MSKSDEFIARNFGFKDKGGEEYKIFIRAVHGLDAGSNEIQIDGEVIKTFTKKLAALEAEPEAFSFKFQGKNLAATLSANV